MEDNLNPLTIPFKKNDGYLRTVIGGNSVDGRKTFIY